MNSISDHIIKENFGGELEFLSPALSCAYKHLLVYYQLQDDAENDIYLVLEDDIVLYSNFCQKLNIIIEEIKSRNLSNFIISIEDSMLRYVKRSNRKKEIVLYPEKHGRLAGAYLMDKKAANNLLEEMNRNKCCRPIDWFHNHCSEIGLINIYWSHPTIAIQGSLNGMFPSTIDNKKFGISRIFKFQLTRAYKKILYAFR